LLTELYPIHNREERAEEDSEVGYREEALVDYEAKRSGILESLPGILLND